MSDTNLAEAPDAAPPPPDPGASSSAALAPSNPLAPPKQQSTIEQLLERATAPVDPQVKQQFVDFKQRQMGAYGQQQGIDNQRYNEDRARVQKAMDAEQFSIDHTPKWDAEAEKAKYHTDPFQEFGSFASVFAMVASAFTHQPMVNALNGAAAAINAKRDNNEQEYARALEAFKTNADMAVKRFNMQHTALGDAFSLMDRDETRGRAKLQEAMTKFGMEKELMLYQNGMIPEIMQSQEAQVSMIQKVAQISHSITQDAQNQQKIDQTARRDEAKQEMDYWRIQAINAKTEVEKQRAEQNYSIAQQKYSQAFEQGNRRLDIAQQNADASTNRAASTAAKVPVVTPDREKEIESQRRYKAVLAELDPSDPDFEKKRESAWEATHQSVAQATVKPITSKQRNDIVTQVSQYDANLAEMDRAIALIEKYGDVGLGGKLKRGAETVGNLIGLSNRTDAQQVKASIAELRLRAPALLTQSKAALPRLKSSAELVEDIIPGLELGATSQSVLDQLKKLRPEFQKLRAGTQELLGAYKPASFATGASAPAGKPAERSETPPFWGDAKE